MINESFPRFFYLFLFILFFETSAVSGETGKITVVKDGISGVVKSADRPESGVWVIARAEDLIRRHIKIVVTDEHGRFMIPELPEAIYKVWVRGYGLVDSEPVEAEPGERLKLAALVAPSKAVPAEYYPANYWYSLIDPSFPETFPGTGHLGNGITENVRTQQDWLALLKDGYVLCHQIGNEAIRELADNSRDGWAERIAKARPLGDRTVVNQGSGMSSFMHVAMVQYGFRRGIGMYADWTRRIDAGEIPPKAPPHPAGAERGMS